MAMGKSEASVKSQSKSKKKDKDVLPTKVVMRRLPASLTEEQLKGLLNGAPEFDFFRFVPADHSLVQHAFSRAYINFKQFEDVAVFRNAFDGYIVNAGKGDESSAVVEVAPFQGIPREARRRKDPKCGVITKDADYEAFLENLNKKVEPFPSAEVYVEEMEQNKSAGATEKVQTPLTEFLNKKKAARNYSRQNALILENERKMKREKEARDSSKSMKDDENHPGKTSSSRSEKSDFSKGSQDKRNSDSKRKEERRERRSGSGKKNKIDRDAKDQKKAEVEDDRPLSARSDSSKRSEGRINKREERRHQNDRRGHDERRNRDERRDEKRDERSHRKTEEQKKSSRAETVKDGGHSVRRRSIEFEDPSIVAFGKSVDGKSKVQGREGAKGKEPESNEERKTGEAERQKGSEVIKGDKLADDGDRKKRNKERPEMVVYRPPVARQDRGKGRDDRAGTDKSRIKSPPGTKSPEKKDRTYERNYRKDRPRSGQKEQDRDYGEKERERIREKERRNREQERRDKDKEREKRKEKEKIKEGTSK